MYPPSITSVSPASARVGETITITGLRFGPTKELATVKLNGIACEINAWSNTSISCNVPHTCSGTLIVTTRTNNVVDYGALGDGATDDTAAIQDAIDDLPPNGSILYFPAGTYKVKAPAIETDRILALADTNIKVMGDGMGVSTIKVANACPTYQWLLGPDTGATDLTGLEICDLTFDHNSDNNPVMDAGEIAAWPQYSCGTYEGSDINLHDFEVVNSSSTNNVVVNGVGYAGANITVKNIQSSNIGKIDGTHIEHDMSLFYICGSDYEISGCTLDGAAGATVGAVEAHGTDFIIKNNAITDFGRGINACGIHVADTENVAVHDNTITDCTAGIVLYSEQYLTHIAGYGLNGCEVYNNEITVTPFGGVGDTEPRRGIGVYGSADLDINNLNIHDNNISSTLETVPGGWDSNSVGIGWLPEIGSPSTLKNSFITDNTVTDFPAAGVILNIPIDTVVVSGNTFTNCGSTMAAGVDDFWKACISMFNYGSIDTYEISDNVFIDDNATTRICYFVYLWADLAATDITLHDNTYSLTGDGVSIIRPLEVDSNLVRPVIAETILDFVPPIHNVISPGTSIIDGITVWTVGVDELTWTQT